METNIIVETPKSKEFTEKKALLELDKEIVELRHKYKMEELKTQREFTREEHIERMEEIAKKSESIQKVQEEKQRKLREGYERRTQRFKERHGNYD